MALEAVTRKRLEWLAIAAVYIWGLAATAPLMAQSSEPSEGPRPAGHADVWGPIFTSQVGRCWKKPKLSADAAKAEAVFSIKLTRDGKLEGPPVPEKAPTTPDQRLLQESGLRALFACQPYKLPADFYEEWKHFAPVFTDLDSLMW